MGNKRYIFLLFSIFAILILSSYIDVVPERSFWVSNMDKEPVLPDIPYTYTDIEFPAHFFDQNSNSGYDTHDEDIDTIILPLTSDDIATLGRVLFYDEKLSALENISCGSCHKQEKSFADDGAFSTGVNAETKRNSLALNDLGWTANDAFFWDLSQQNIHEMIKLPLTDDNEIGADMNQIGMKLSSTSYYPSLFTKAFGTPEVTEDRIVVALVQFITSMTTFNSRFDELANNGFEDSNYYEKIGKDVFSNACASCHVEGSLFSNVGGSLPIEFLLNSFPEFFDNGLDMDPEDIGAGNWNQNFSGLYKVPSLRNIKHTGPYMHDGSMNSLEEVIEFYSSGVEATASNQLIPVGGFDFGDIQKLSLLAFLETLSDETFLSDPKFSDPFLNSVEIPEKPEMLQLIHYTVYPNPTANELTISMAEPPIQPVSMTIYDQSGQFVLEQVFDQAELVLDVSNYSSGVYYIQLISGGQKSNQRLVIQ